MTREQKIAKARELRAEGKTAGEISIAIGVPTSTIRNWWTGGTCPDCGHPIEKVSVRCKPCANKAAAIWDRAKIVKRIREWNDRFGQPPSGYDWNPCLAEGQSCAALVRRRFASGDWPASSIVAYHFGSWNAAVEAAGFEPRSSGERGPDRGPRIGSQAVAA